MNRQFLFEDVTNLTQLSQINQIIYQEKLMPLTHKNRSLSDIETDLMNCLLKATTIDYPWNPADPDTADYYARSDRHFCLENWSDTELYVGVASLMENRYQFFLIW